MEWRSPIELQELPKLLAFPSRETELGSCITPELLYAIQPSMFHTYVLRLRLTSITIFSRQHCLFGEYLKKIPKDFTVESILEFQKQV